MIRQLSIFIQNDKGRLSKVLRILARNNLNIRTLTIVDTFDYGIVRLILEDVDEAIAALKAEGIMVHESSVFAAEIPDTPGGMYTFIDAIAEADINVEYVYSFSQKKTPNAVIIFKVCASGEPHVQDILKDHQAINLLTHDQLMVI